MPVVAKPIIAVIVAGPVFHKGRAGEIASSHPWFAPTISAIGRPMIPTKLRAALLEPGFSHMRAYIAPTIIINVWNSAPHDRGEEALKPVTVRQIRIGCPNSLSRNSSPTAMSIGESTAPILLTAGYLSL